MEASFRARTRSASVCTVRPYFAALALKTEADPAVINRGPKLEKAPKADAANWCFRRFESEETVVGRDDLWSPSTGKMCENYTVRIHCQRAQEYHWSHVREVSGSNLSQGTDLKGGHDRFASKVYINPTISTSTLIALTILMSIVQ
jgi:hypothetical protein